MILEKLIEWALVAELGAFIYLLVLVGYGWRRTSDIPILKHALGKATSKLEDVQEWAFQMECMYEDCTYLSHEAFNEDAESHLKKLVELVGKWIPPEIRVSSQEAK